MRKPLWLVGLLLSSVLLYLIAASVVYRPLTVGDVARQLDYKIAYAKRLQSPKIMILAGSNGRYSHRCESLSSILGRPCVNASIATGIGLDFLLDQFLPVLRAGDTLYMPLEYGQYSQTESAMHHGIENSVMLHDRTEYLWSLPAKRIVTAYASVDLSDLIRGIIEMALASRGFHRRTGLDTLTLEGDQRGHTAQAGAAYRAYLSAAPLPATDIPASSYSITVLERFLHLARERGITVVGGLPTVPAGTTISDTDVSRIRRIFETSGQQFIALPAYSRYPTSCFFDSVYHLDEECQIRHSLAIADLLRHGSSKPQ